MNYKELAKDILKLHEPDPDVILEIAREQQATLKQFDESFKEGVKVLAKAHAQLIEAQESEAVWKTVADKADQRRIEAEARLAEAEDLIRRGHAGWQKSQAEVERLTGRMKEAEDLIKGLHEGWKKARKAHLETCKNAQSEIDKLHTENVCLQEYLRMELDTIKRTTI